jgi:hypothetical protein
MLRRLGMCAWLGWASIAWAEESAAGERPGEPEPLGSVSTVRALCLAMRPADRVLWTGDDASKAKAREAHESARVAALGRRYRARVPAGGFRFLEYREQDGALVVDLGRPLRTLRGAVTLASQRPEAGLPMSAEAAGNVSASAMLDVTFVLDPSAANPCSGSVAADVFQLRIVPASIDLLDRSGRPLAHFEPAPEADATAPANP